MRLSEKIKMIEAQTTRHPDWFYHAFFLDTEIYTSMLTEGIKCASLLGKKGSGNNGLYYISLSKDIGTPADDSAFHGYKKIVSNIIVDNIEPIKCLNTYFFHFLANTSLPIRCSGFKDEYQAYKIIEPDKFVGLQCPLYYWAQGYQKDKIYKYYLENLKSIILIMKKFGITLPLYDYTRLQEQSVHQINPDAFIEIFDNSIRRLTPEESYILKKNKSSR